MQKFKVLIMCDGFHLGLVRALGGCPLIKMWDKAASSGGTPNTSTNDQLNLLHDLDTMY